MTLSADNPIEWTGLRLPNSARQLSDVLQDPTLWNRHRLRTTYEGPHRHVDDIWVRCLDWEIMRDSPVAFNEPHDSTWYPIAHEQLAPARDLARDIAEYFKATKIGGVLITKIPAGCCVLPHIDNGWHARHYEKFAFSIAANEMQEFCFDRKRLTTHPGDVFTFDNQYSHWVTNPSTTDRITMIVCIRRE